ncbi:MAG: ferritin-like domain-containing protein [Halanaerobiales bacterium]
MNVLKFALDFEEKNHDYYLKRSQNTNNNALKELFLQLANEEKRHIEIVKQLSSDTKVEHVESNILDSAKKAFDKIASDIPDTVLPKKQVHIYKVAVRMEKKSYEYYKEKAEETDLPHVNTVLEKLADEEKKHQTIMENITEMVDRPNTWLEDAEWYHFEQY